VSVSRRVTRSCIGSVTACSLILAQLPSAAFAQTAPSQPVAPSVAITIEECDQLNSPQAREQFRRITEGVLQRELGQVDYSALVEKHWREARVGERLDVEIDSAINAERERTGTLDRWYSNISSETAITIAKAVAERAYGSDGVKSALEDLAQGVGKDFGAKVETAAQALAAPIVACISTALQNRYGGAIAQAFTRETGAQFDISTQAGTAKFNASDLALERLGSISGIALIVSRSLVRRLAASLGRRMAGLLATRALSMLTGIGGLLLLAYDLSQAYDGVFPIIAERMKSDEAKDQIKQEITKSLSEELSQQIGKIAADTSDYIYSTWLDFKQKYDVLLRLAEQNTDFARFLSERRVEQLSPLGQLVGFLLGQEREEGVFRRTRDGSLGKALLDLGPDGVQLVMSLQSLDKALAWAGLAGSQLPKVVEFGLPERLQPEELDRKQLEALLSLDSRATAQRMAGLDRAARDALLSLPPQELIELTRRHSERELASIALYQSRLARPAAARVLREVTTHPESAQVLAKPTVEKAIIASRDQLSAVDMLLRRDMLFNFARIDDDFQLVRAGDVDFRVFLERYWLTVLLIAFGALLLLTILRRMLFGRPTTIVVRTSDGKERR
jgi:hypothetical protein